jgi:hypothetical protein
MEKAMKRSIAKLIGAITLLSSACVLAGCGGTKVLKEPEPFIATPPLASGSDQRIAATLDWVIVRDGPGTWARNADWDEYLIRIQSLADDPIYISNIALLDSQGTRTEPRQTRSQLVKGTKETKRRYKGEGIQVKAGASGGALIVAGAVTGAAAVSIGSAALFTSEALAGAALGGIVLAPALVVGGVVRNVNNHKVDEHIRSRQTLLPVELQEKAEKRLNIFFPLTPSPRQIELTYIDSTGEHTLAIDTPTELQGLHLVTQNEGQ